MLRSFAMVLFETVLTSVLFLSPRREMKPVTLWRCARIVSILSIFFYNCAGFDTRTIHVLVLIIFDYDSVAIVLFSPKVQREEQQQRSVVSYELLCIYWLFRDRSV